MEWIFLEAISRGGKCKLVPVEILKGFVKVKQSHYRPGQALRVQEVEANRFQDSWHMRVVSLSALTGCLYLPGNIPGTHFC